MNRGLGCALIVIVFMSIVTASGIYAIATKIADYGEAREQTKQVQIVADASVSMAQINADTTVTVAKINADATKKTSMAFVAFYAVRALLVGGGIVWALVAGAVIQRWMVRHGN